MNGFQESKDDQSSAQDARTQSGMKKRKYLTQERVRELFDYDPETGLLTRIKQVSNRTKVGTIVTGINKGGYFRACIDGKRYLLHRVIWLWYYGYMPENPIDHINRNKIDNSISNLREVSISCNIRNSKLFFTNASGVRGISVDNFTGMWVAKITVDRKNLNLGRSYDFVEAVAHRLAAEQCVSWDGCENNSTAYQYMQEYLKGNKQNETSN